MTRTAEAKEEITTWRRMQRGLRPDLRLERGGFPVYRRTPLCDLTPRPYQEGVCTALAAYVEWFPGHWRLGTGMTLIGAAGLGKTTLACALAAELVINHEYIAAFTTLDRYIRNQRRMMSLDKLTSGGDVLAQEAREEIGDILNEDWILRRGAYLVVLDDVGREHRTSSGWAAQEFDSLLRERYDSGLPTIITSNMTLDKWDKEYSQSMRSFVQESCPVVDIRG